MRTHICLGQSVTCLAADPGVASSIQTRSETFAEIDCEIISRTFSSLLLIQKKVVVSYKRKYVHEVLVNRLVKLLQEENVAR